MNTNKIIITMIAVVQVVTMNGSTARSRTGTRGGVHTAARNSSGGVSSSTTYKGNEITSRESSNQNGLHSATITGAQGNAITRENASGLGGRSTEITTENGRTITPQKSSNRLFNSAYTRQNSSSATESSTKGSSQVGKLTKIGGLKRESSLEKGSEMQTIALEGMEYKQYQNNQQNAQNNSNSQGSQTDPSAALFNAEANYVTGTTQVSSNATAQKPTTPAPTPTPATTQAPTSTTTTAS